MDENVLHDLIMLFLQNSNIVTSSDAPEDYVTKYLEVKGKIKAKYSELRPSRPAKSAGVIRKGIEY